MFGKKKGRAMSQMAKKAAPKIAQKAPAQKLPSGLVNTPTDKLNAFRGAAQKAPAAQMAKRPMGALQAFANRSKAPAQPAPKMPMAQEEALFRAFEAAQNQAKGAMGSQQALAQAKNMAGAGMQRAVPLNNAGARMPMGSLLQGVATPKTQSATNAAMGASSGMLKPFGAKKGGSVPASKRADGIVKKGKTKGRMV